MSRIPLIRRNIMLLTLAMGAAGCTHPTGAAGASPQSPRLEEPVPTPDQAFAALSQRYLDGYFQRSPEEATINGDHRYDGRWSDFSVEGEAEDRRFLEDTLEQLGRIPRRALSTDNQVDAEILENQLRYGLFALTELRSTELRSVSYTQTIGAGLDPFITRNFGTRQSRIASLISRLDGIPAMVAVAKQRLGRPSRVQTETALQQNAGLIALTEHTLPTQFGDAAGLAAAAGRAAAALRELQGFLEKELLPRSDGSFRLGPGSSGPSSASCSPRTWTSTRWRRRPGSSSLARRRRWSTRRSRSGRRTAWGSFPPRHAGAEAGLRAPGAGCAGQDRPTSASILRDSKAWLDRATAFVREKDLVRVPDEPVAVIEMPEYRRGSAWRTATPPGRSSQGPRPSSPFLRPRGLAAGARGVVLPRVQPVDARRPHRARGDARALPAADAQQPVPSKLRAVLSSGPFVEGWAVYSEWLMAEKGFGGPKVKLQRQKMVLRMAANALLDHGVHAGKMEEKEALALMMGEAFQEEGEAVGKWRRARLTSAQLTTYFFGFTEMYKLRQASQVKPGFSERAYHDRLLSWGSPGMKIVRRLMSGTN
jgi:hypothetical protein